MAKQRPKQPGKQREKKQRDKAAKPRPKRQDEPQEGKREFDIVEEAGKESFPASDAPSWNP